MARLDDEEWLEWLAAELELLDLEELARLLGAELLREGSTARMLVRCSRRRPSPRI